MSKISLAPDASGTGIFTIASPGTSTNRTLTLPDDTGTIDRLNRAGNVLQVVSYTESTDYSTSSSTYQQGPQTSTLSLANASSKVFVVAQVLIQVVKGAGSYSGIRIAIYQGSIASGTRLTAGNEPQFLQLGASEQWAWQTLSFLDTPGADTTYSVGFNCHPETSAGKSANIKGTVGQTVITMMEIAA